MRFSRPTPIVAALVLILTGCPKNPGATAPSQAGSRDGARIQKLARILRAADRRLVDEDLRTLIADGDAVVRAKAALAMGQIADPSYLPDLVKAAADLSDDTRASAAFAMGLIADLSTQPTLTSLSGDPSSRVRAAAAEALGRLHDPAGAATIGSLLGDKDMAVRAAASLAAWKFADAESLIDALIGNVAGEDVGVRGASAYALARLASAGTVPPSSGAPVGRLSDAGVDRAKAALVARVSDASPEVRMQVARGLASPRAGSELATVGALLKDRDTGVRTNAARSFGYPGLPIKPYLERALTDPDQSVVHAAIEAVGKVGGAPAEETLMQLLPNLPKGWLKEVAVSALARNSPQMLPGLVSGLLVNADPVMRASAAALLAGRRNPEAVAAAMQMLRDPEPRVQVAAIPLVADRDAPIATLLAGFTTSTDPVVRAAAAEAVGGRLANPNHAETKDELFAELEKVWIASSADILPDAKLSFVDAIAKGGADDRTRSALNRALSDPDVVVRRRAVARFKDVYGEDRSRDVGAAADRPLSDYESIARFALAPHSAVITMRRTGSQEARFSVALDANAAPLAAWNFAQLAGRKFFDGATLHRVVPNFVVQDGDPRGDGYGGPGYSIRDEFNPLPFSAGVLGMASDGKDTAGSQWFITLSAQPHLDGRYTSFGKVTEGLRAVVSQMRPGDTVVSVRVDEAAETAGGSKN